MAFGPKQPGVANCQGGALVTRFTLPALPEGKRPGVLILPPHDIAGKPIVAVVMRSRAGQSERVCFFDDAEALAFALSEADARHLPLLDMRKSEPEDQ